MYQLQLKNANEHSKSHERGASRAWHVAATSSGSRQRACRAPDAGAQLSYNSYRLDRPSKALFLIRPAG
ncbi:hypothetical protein THAOC_19880 [Thalassiosira oceanica]|uniref:Uncharacterized protein n=1 Tax=Thalassiosira oceanica TaxID=159749 RepID=K0S3M9_THAOC|nr:hypothetical protein THAOC_19880 [Thalassiosira oceanica]|eukprot:EJK59845.1 hypothetical protein THAOC_19880 [Thalassiosira oceanica]